MSTFEPVQQQGSWGAVLRSPMPVPVGGIDEGDLINFCVSKAWLPAILTGLKLLTRPESWVGTQTQVQDAVSSAHMLMGLWEDGCGAIDVAPNWKLIFSSVVGGPVGGKWELNEVPGREGNTREYEGVFPGTGLPGDQSANISVEGRLFVGNNRVGGHFREFYAHSASGVGYAYVCTRMNCLFETETFSGFTPLQFSGDYQFIQVIFGNSPVFLRCVIQDNWLCGPA